MKPRYVSAPYLLGIRDEREMLKAEIARGETDTLSFARDMLANIKHTLAQGFAGEMAEYMRGGRDFWANQVRKEMGK